MSRLSTLTAIILALSVAERAVVQQERQENDVIQEGVIGLVTWGYEGLYEEGSWTAEQLLDADVYGTAGDEIGEVENIVVGTVGLTEAVNLLDDLEGLHVSARLI